MNVRNVAMEQFLSHAKTSVDFPERGLVLITGSNGAGKSTFPEAVAVANWGKSLRGTDPWKTGLAGSVKCTSDLGVSTRKVTAKGTKNATFVADPNAPIRRLFDTNTKAKDAAEQVLGDLDMWRRTHVFSSADADNFTNATDATRKELLEELLHLGCFDAGWKKCREDLRAAEQDLASKQTTLDLAVGTQNRIDAAIQAIATAPPEPEPVPPEPFDAQELAPALMEQERLAEAMREARQKSNEAIARQRPSDLTKAANMAEAEVRAASAHLRAVSAGSCSACGQAIDDKHREEATLRHVAAQEAYKIADEALRQAGRAAQVDFDTCQKQIADIQAQQLRSRDSLQEIQQRQRSWETHLAQHAAWASRQASRDQQRSDLEAQWQSADDAIYEAQQAVTGANAEVAELNVVSEVLGLKGVRAHVLGQALGGIEAVANIYLERIAQKPLKLTLKSYTESAKGNVQDKISMEVEGAGGGHGYKASSGGERRRIDAALLLALAEVSSAASGKEPGTIWMDEVFDALDTDGIDAVVEVLSELAIDRAVVVITHAEALAARIPAVKCIRVVDGTVV